jgi:ABC-type phosphonate transport system ATPase subunit
MWFLASANYKLAYVLQYRLYPPKRGEFQYHQRSQNAEHEVDLAERKNEVLMNTGWIHQGWEQELTDWQN